MKLYDLIVIGSGPGGYVAAIKSAQLGMKTAIVERAELGGICLNWGCIPTKALLKSAQVYQNMKHCTDYGIVMDGMVRPDFEAIVRRSRTVAESMSQGIRYLLKKNNIDVLAGTGKLLSSKEVEVTPAEGEKAVYTADHIILATGASSRRLSALPQDGRRIIGYKEAMTLPELPQSMVIVGSGAIGSEFAFFYNSLGVQVTLIELLPNILPIEDEESSKQIERSFRKQGMKLMTGTSVEKVSVVNDKCRVFVKDKKSAELELETDIVLSAVGIETNITGIGLEETGVLFQKGKILVDEYYRTNIDGIYAIGDIVQGQALAHVASREAIICVEKIAGHHPEHIDYENIPSCTYTTPEVASVGMTEKQAIERGYAIRTGKFPFTASGKAASAGNKEGMIKVIFDAETHLLLGCHMVGEHVTEMIAEAVLVRKTQTTAEQITASVHPHPTMSEAFMEATEAAFGKAVHL
ncbi:MAG: dihydrolipoyl dehydrogenase [Bacteroidales bacterium]|nr:dihydrolipoyl dehydrogenase [Bacteroidales bacterium]